jgi:HEPN domain-containing protein
MPSREQVEAVAAEWTQKADDDLKAAGHLLRLGRECPTATVAFHAQQCIEKCLKAVLVVRGIRFPRTHDIEELVGLLPLDVHPRLSVEMQRTLTAYATITRYPGDYEPVTLPEARQAVAAARRVRRLLRLAQPAGRGTDAVRE